MSTNLKTTLTLLVVASTLLVANTLYAWTAPTQNPPNGNVSVPLNEGSSSQVKNGALGVNTLAVYGNAGVNGSLTAGSLCLAGVCNGTWPSKTQITLHTIRAETYASITLANTDCQQAGYDGVWAVEDENGTEPILCYTSNVITGVNSVVKSVTPNSLVAGWPDAIVCTVNGTARYINYATWMPSTSNQYVYLSGGTTAYGDYFNPDGSFIKVGPSPSTNNCNNKSIAQLVQAGQAFFLNTGQY